MNKLSVTSREVLPEELKNLVVKARQIAQKRRHDVGAKFWFEKFEEINQAAAKRWFFKREYTLDEVKEIVHGSDERLKLFFRKHSIDEDIGRFNLLERLCTRAFSDGSIQLSADDNNLISYYIEKRFEKHDS